MQVNIDTNYNSWLKEIPNDQIENIVNKYLKLGYIITLTDSQLNISNDIFNPIKFFRTIISSSKIN